MPVFWTRNKSEVDQAKHRIRYPQLKTQALHWTQYLNFNDHLYTLTSSLLSTIYQISRVRHLFTKPVLSTVLNSLIFSKPFYCSTVWAGTSKQNLQKLQLVQNFAARVLTDTKKFDHISPVLRELGWPSIKDQLLVRDTTQQIQNKIKQNC